MFICSIAEGRAAIYSGIIYIDRWVVPRRILPRFVAWIRWILKVWHSLITLLNISTGVLDKKHSLTWRKKMFLSERSSEISGRSSWRFIIDRSSQAIERHRANVLCCRRFEFLKRFEWKCVTILSFNFMRHKLKAFRSQNKIFFVEKWKTPKQLRIFRVNF